MNEELTPLQQESLSRSQKMADEIKHDIIAKDAGGIIEHGGGLWMKNSIREAYKEGLDNLIYLHNHIEQLNRLINAVDLVLAHVQDPTLRELLKSAVAPFHNEIE